MIFETIYIDSLRQLVPTVMFLQLGYNVLESYAVQRVMWLCRLFVIHT